MPKPAPKPKPHPAPKPKPAGLSPAVRTRVLKFLHHQVLLPEHHHRLDPTLDLPHPGTCQRLAAAPAVHVQTGFTAVRDLLQTLHSAPGKALVLLPPLQHLLHQHLVHQPAL